MATWRTPKQKKTQWKNGSGNWTWISQKKEEKKKTTKKMSQKCLSFPAMIKTQLKIFLIFHFIPVRMQKINKTMKNKCWRWCQETEFLSTVGGIVKLVQSLWNKCGETSNNKNKSSVWISYLVFYEIKSQTIRCLQFWIDRMLTTMTRTIDVLIIQHLYVQIVGELLADIFSISHHKAVYFYRSSMMLFKEMTE